MTAALVLGHDAAGQVAEGKRALAAAGATDFLLAGDTLSAEVRRGAGARSVVSRLARGDELVRLGGDR